MDKERILIILGIIVLFLSTRIILLYSINTRTEITSSEESGRIGVIGYQWLQGHPGFYLNVPFKTQTHHQLGIIMKGALAGLFFWVFGIFWQSLMFTTVLEGFLLLLLVYFFLEKYFSYSSAVLGSLFYIFLFPTWIMTTTSQPATILLGILCSFSILYLFFKLHLNNRDYLSTALFGFLAGFSVFLQLFGSLLTLFSIFIYSLLLIVSKKFQIEVSIKEAGTFALSLILGLLPFLYYHFFLYGGENTFTLHGQSIFKSLSPSTGSLSFAHDLLNYFTNSFGFQWFNLGDFGLFLNSVFLSTGTLLFIFLVYSSRIYVILKGRLQALFENNQTKICLMLLILVLVNLSIFLLEPINTRLTHTKKSLQRTFEYVSYLHFLFLLTLPISYSKIKKWRNLFGVILIILLFLGTCASIYAFSSQTGNYVYGPVKGLYYQTIKTRNRPDLYKMKHEIFAEPFSITKTEVRPGADIPPFPRSLVKMREICAEHPNTKTCYKITGIYFADIRRYNLESSLDLCERLNPNYFEKCKEGVSWALGYFVSYNKSIWKYCNSSDLNLSYVDCLKGIKAGREALQYEEIFGANLTRKSTRRVKKATREYEKLI